MLEDWEPTLGSGPLLAIALGAIALLLVLIIKFKIHAFVALVLVSLLTALAAGIPVGDVSTVLIGSFSTTLGAVALLIGFGAMLGRLIEQSGGATVLADKLVSLFGESRAPFALGIASLIMGFPMFFDAGLIMMLPIIFAVAHRLSDNNVLLYGMPAAAAFSVMHVFLPPHPGPVAASEFYGASIGLVLLVGLILAFPLWYVAGYLWGKFVGRKYVLPVPAIFGPIDDDELPKNPPSAGTVIGLLLIPMTLILLNTGLKTLGSAGVIDADQPWAQALILIGNSPIALLITLLVATVVLGYRRGEKGTVIERTLDSSLGPICGVVMITGAGGMFGGVLRESGIGDALSDTLSGIGIPVIFAAFLIAVVLRIAQGSATVALVTAAGLMAPAVTAGGFNAMQIACITLATAAGSVCCSHVNDSGFWLVGRLMGMDVKTTLKVWTVQQTIQAFAGFAVVLVVFGVASAF